MLESVRQARSGPRKRRILARRFRRMPRHMVHKCGGRYEPRTGGAPLTGTGAGPDDNARNGRQDLKLRISFVIVLALAALALAGCGAVGGDSGPSGGGDAGSSGASGPGNTRGEVAKLGTPSLGRADAPVVLTEYSDYQ